MGSELSALAQSGSGSLISVMTADLWNAAKKILVRAFHGVRGGNAGPSDGTRTEHPVPAAGQSFPAQSNTARDSGTVFAVQHGDQVIGANWRGR